MIRLIPVDKSEPCIQVLYQLLNERPESANISHSDMPTMQQHRKFVASHPYRAWYLIQYDGVVRGSIYITHHNEIGIAILKPFQGQGLATSAIREVMRKHKPLAELQGVRSGKWLANINPNNEVSIRMFTRMGFEHVQQTYALAV